MTYSQPHGIFVFKSGSNVKGCYAGQPAHKNNPADQGLKGLGPIPQGHYTLSPLHTAQHLGPCVFLTPDFSTREFILSLGREPYSFYIHLDNPAHVGASSDGCIVPPSYAALLEIEKQRVSGDVYVDVIGI